MHKTKVIYNLLALVLLGFALLVMFPMKFGLFTKISQYGVQMIFIYIMLGMIFLIVDLRRLMFASLASAAILSLFLKKHSNYNLVLPQENQESSISIAHLNLANAGPNINEFLFSLSNVQTDLISFQEYTPFWDKILAKEIIGDYPYYHTITRIDPHGLAIFSKLPLTNADTLLSDITPIIISSIEMGSQNLDIYASYIAPPIDNLGTLKSKKQLEQISIYIEKRKNPAIVVGEFNDVYWSDKIRNFTSQNLLANSRRNTTPAAFNIPYDHIFYSQNLECTMFRDIMDFDNTKLGIVGRYQFKIGSSFNPNNPAFGYR